jgi:hypothetical protein
MTVRVRPMGFPIGFSMSSTDTSNSTSTTTDEDAVFDRVVWSDPEVCNHCFNRFRTLTTFDDDLRHTATDVTPSGTYDYTTDEHANSPALRTHDPRSTCGECGSVSGLAATNDLSKRESLGRVPELADRVREAGFDVNERAMRALIKKVKSRPDLQGRDREMFERTVRIGIEFA